MSQISIANSVIQLSIDTQRGNSISSLQVNGVETIDTSDLGRGVQASIYFPASVPGAAICAGVDRHWVNLQSGGNDEGTPARICHGPIQAMSEIEMGVYPQLSPFGGELWEGESGHYFRIFTSYSLGPLAQAPFQEVVQLRFRFQSTRPLEFSHQVCDQEGYPTIVPFLPFAFVKADVLSRLYGLNPGTGEWSEQHPNAGRSYHPSQYRMRTMAWMRPDLGWGLAVYGASAITNPGENNFAAQSFPSYAVNQLCLVDPSLTTIAPTSSGKFDDGSTRKCYLVVGNLATIKHVIGHIERADL